MAYVYLLDFYKFIDARLEDATGSLETANDDQATAKFGQGRIDALTEFQHFLKENFNPKLPRRIREAYFKT